MMQNIAVSVILPTYNSSNYIDRILCELCNQTLSNIEIICIDDCSTDDTWIKLNRIKEKDARILVYEKERNTGAACSMNIAIAMASGKYIIFVDHDDEVEPEYVERLYNTINKGDYDIVCTNVKYTDKKGNVYISDFPISQCKNYDMLTKMIELLIITQKSDKVCFVPMFSLWAKIYRKDLICTIDCEQISERVVASTDFLFNLQAMLKSKKVAYIPDIFYYYNYVHGSMSKQYKHRSFGIRYHSVEIAKRIIENSENNKKDIYLHRLYYRLWMIYTYSASNELKRNPVGFNAALKQIKKNAEYPLVKVALNHIMLKECSWRGIYKVFAYGLYYYTKIYLLCHEKQSLV